MRTLFSSIRLTIFIGTFIAVLIPLSFAIWYTTAISKEKLYDEFAKFRQETTHNVAKALTNPMYYFSPNNGGLVLELLKQDPRVVKVNAYDTLNEIDFLEIYIPTRDKGTTFSNEAIISKDGEPIGYVTILYNDSALTSLIQKQAIFFIQIFILIFIALFCVLFPLLYIKILAPIQKLTDQAKNLKAKKLENSYTWTGNDEISLLGQSFELARHNILELINELQETSVTDRLTKLYNRHKLDTVLIDEQRRSNRYGHSFGILLIDIDNFKHINDTYGHQIGDTVLFQIATILKNNCREIDIVGRWGGEEFLVIIPESTQEGTLLLAEKLKNIIFASTFETDETITISVGVALYTQNELVHDLISRADKALYKAKSTGKNRVIFA